jgi:hypothetical protein
VEAEPDPEQKNTRDALRRELELVLIAISLVASGGASGVTLAGLQFCSADLAGSTAAAHSAGVVLEPIWQADLAQCDIRVHRWMPSTYRD